MTPPAPCDCIAKPSAPRAATGIPQSGGARTGRTASSNPPTIVATIRIHRAPNSISARPTPSIPSGHRTAARTADGMTSAPITGTTSRFATIPYCAERLK